MMSKWNLLYRNKGKGKHVVETFTKKADAKKELDMRKGLVYVLEKRSTKDIYFLQRVY